MRLENFHGGKLFRDLHPDVLGRNAASSPEAISRHVHTKAAIEYFLKNPKGDLSYSLPLSEANKRNFGIDRCGDEARLQQGVARVVEQAIPEVNTHFYTAQRDNAVQALHFLFTLNHRILNDPINFKRVLWSFLRGSNGMEWLREEMTPERWQSLSRLAKTLLSEQHDAPVRNGSADVHAIANGAAAKFYLQLILESMFRDIEPPMNGDTSPESLELYRQNTNGLRDALQLPGGRIELDGGSSLRGKLQMPDPRFRERTLQRVDAVAGSPQMKKLFLFNTSSSFHSVRLWSRTAHGRHNNLCKLFQRGANQYDWRYFYLMFDHEHEGRERIAFPDADHYTYVPVDRFCIVHCLGDAVEQHILHPKQPSSYDDFMKAL